MSVGLGLLHRFLKDKLPVSFLSDKGLTEELFSGKEKTIFDAILEHVRDFGKVPQIKTLEAETKVKFPEFPDEPIDYWIERVERRRQSEMVLKVSNQMIEDAADGDIETARSKLKQLYLDLETRYPTDRVVELTKASDEVVRLHDKAQRSGEKITGIPFGIRYLDDISGGAQPGDAIALVGRPGLGKSYLLLRIALNGSERDYTPLVVSLEMRAVQCARRLLALKSGVPATMVRLGKLGFWGREKMLADIGRLKEMKGAPFYLMEGSLDSTIEDVILKVRELKPDALYVDGAYTLKTREQYRSRWEQVSETAEILKRIAGEFAIPVVATYQFNRRGPGSLGNIGLSDAVGQLASIVIGMDDEEEGDVIVIGARQYKTLELLKGREGERGKIRLLYDMERMKIEQDSVLSGYETENNDA